jgi:hypothetical protein
MAPKEFLCPAGATFSPAPTQSPIVPTISPAPTIATVKIVVNIYLDEHASDVWWSILERDSDQVVVQRPFGTYQYENEVTETVYLRPERAYIFTILDKYGDGLSDGGFYQVLTDDGSPLVTGEGSFGRERTHEFRTPAFDALPAASSSASPTLTGAPIYSDAPSGVPSLPPSLIPAYSPSSTSSNSPTVVATDAAIGRNDNVAAGTNVSGTCTPDYFSCSGDGDCCNQFCQRETCVPSSPAVLDEWVPDRDKAPGGAEHRPP